MNSLTPQDSEISRLQARINELESGQSRAQQEQQQALLSSAQTQIETFKSDHPDFDELATDIARLLETGGANTLQEAYEAAKWLNPTARQKELDRLTAEKLTSAEKTQRSKANNNLKATAVNLSTSPKSRDGTIPLGSMDETLEATLAAIQSR